MSDSESEDALREAAIASLPSWKRTGPAAVPRADVAEAEVDHLQNVLSAEDEIRTRTEDPARTDNPPRTNNPAETDPDRDPAHTLPLPAGGGGQPFNSVPYQLPAFCPPGPSGLLLRNYPIPNMTIPNQPDLSVPNLVFQNPSIAIPPIPGQSYRLHPLEPFSPHISDPRLFMPGSIPLPPSFALGGIPPVLIARPLFQVSPPPQLRPRFASPHSNNPLMGTPLILNSASPRSPRPPFIRPGPTNAAFVQNDAPMPLGEPAVPHVVEQAAAPAFAAPTSSSASNLRGNDEAEPEVEPDQRHRRPSPPRRLPPTLDIPINFPAITRKPVQSKSPPPDWYRRRADATNLGRVVDVASSASTDGGSSSMDETEERRSQLPSRSRSPSRDSSDHGEKAATRCPCGKTTTTIVSPPAKVRLRDREIHAEYIRQRVVNEASSAPPLFDVNTEAIPALESEASHDGRSSRRSSRRRFRRCSSSRSSAGNRSKRPEIDQSSASKAPAGRSTPEVTPVSRGSTVKGTTAIVADRADVVPVVVVLPDKPTAEEQTKDLEEEEELLDYSECGDDEQLLRPNDAPVPPSTRGAASHVHQWLESQDFDVDLARGENAEGDKRTDRLSGRGDSPSTGADPSGEGRNASGKKRCEKASSSETRAEKYRPVRRDRRSKHIPERTGEMGSPRKGAGDMGSPREESSEMGSPRKVSSGLGSPRKGYGGMGSPRQGSGGMTSPWKSARENLSPRRSPGGKFSSKKSAGGTGRTIDVATRCGDQQRPIIKQMSDDDIMDSLVRSPIKVKKRNPSKSSHDVHESKNMDIKKKEETPLSAKVSQEASDVASRSKTTSDQNGNYITESRNSSMNSATARPSKSSDSSRHSSLSRTSSEQLQKAIAEKKAEIEKERLKTARLEAEIEKERLETFSKREHKTRVLKKYPKSKGLKEKAPNVAPMKTHSSSPPIKPFDESRAPHVKFKIATKPKLATRSTSFE